MKLHQARERIVQFKLPVNDSSIDVARKVLELVRIDMSAEAVGRGELRGPDGLKKLR